MISVTGATGTIGAALVKRLSARGESVRAFVRNAKHKIAFPGVECRAISTIPPHFWMRLEE